jgi:uncharacterized protein DUF4115
VVKPLGTFEWGIVLTGSAVVSVIVLCYAVGWGRSSDPAPELVAIEVKAAKTPVMRPQAPAFAAPPTKTKPRSTFVFMAAGGDSWLQIRSDSFTGRALYEGVLPLGETVLLRSKRLWIRFGAASHVQLSIDGRRTRLPAFGTFDAFAGPRGVVADRTVYATAAQSP